MSILSDQTKEALILSSEYVDYFVHPEFATIELRFNQMSIQCSSNHLKEIFETCAELSKHESIDKIFLNQEKALFIVKNPIVYWLNETFFPTLKDVGIKKCIYLSGSYIFNKLSTERPINTVSRDLIDVFFLKSQEEDMHCESAFYLTIVIKLPYQLQPFHW